MAHPLSALRTSAGAVARRALALAAAVTLASAAAAQDSADVRVMTFNVRFAHTTPPNLWPDRRAAVREMIVRRAPDLIGTQEGLYPQLVDMQADLPGYAWIGLGREGGSRGEFMAIFYRTDRFTPVEFDHYWLSDTPAVVGSTTWGNAVRRMVTWVRFRDRRTGREFYHVNTHFDHQVPLSRLRSAELVLARARELDPALPVVLTGDFNAPAPGDTVYRTLTAAGAFADTWRAAGRAEPPIGTFHGFGGEVQARGGARIDWILTRGPVRTLDTEIVTDRRGTQLPSDHFPVVARVRFAASP
jgi:endonuclease/exonuclease/phosphatase family metal-dependent hydrolase